MKITIEIPDELVDAFRRDCLINTTGVNINGIDVTPIYIDILEKIDAH